MKDGDQSKPATAPAAPAPGDSTMGSGEGAGSALEALIRKRKQAETPDGGEPLPPAPPHP